jgi:DNA-directed RNA polymerase sigma subunit (sigma70/sigma32)
MTAVTCIKPNTPPRLADLTEAVSELELIRRAKGGDEDAMKALVLRYIPYIRTCARNASPELDAHEIESQATEKIPTLVAEFKVEKSKNQGLRPLLAKTIYFIKLNLYRKLDKERTHLPQYALLRQQSQIRRQSDSSQNVLDDSVILKIKSILSSKQIQAIELSLGLDLGTNSTKIQLDDNQIATILETNARNVRKIKSVALGKLRTAFSRNEKRSTIAA